jgi:hypothetical protein
MGAIPFEDFMLCEWQKDRDQNLGLLYALTLAARGPDDDPLTAGGEAQSSIIQVYALTRDTRAELFCETLMAMIASARDALGLPEAILRKKAPRLL